MLKSYIKIAWRSLRKYKAYSIINILGLALGIASCLIIFLVVRYELGYDHFHKKAKRIYRVTLNAIDFNPSVSFAIGPAMHNDFPELERVTQVWFQRSGNVRIGTTAYTEKNWMYADEHFSSVFDYTWLKGDPRTALSEPNSVVLTESLARKYFGTREVMGQVLSLDNQYNLKVTGVLKDLPGNTNLPFNFLVSFETVKKDIAGLFKNFYAIAGGNTFIVLPENVSIQQIQERIPAFITKNWGEKYAKEARLPLQPLLDIHFDQRYLDNFVTLTTSRATYWGLSAVAVLIILIGCINFINLATAQAMRRAKEVGVRKVLGSGRSQLVWQFLGETSLMVLLAMILGFIATRLFLPYISRWLDIKLDAGQLSQPIVLLLALALMLVVIFLAGLYPAFVQSAFRPLESIQNKAVMRFQGLTLRKALVVLQFAICQILVIGTLVVAYQMNFFLNQGLGYNKEAVITFGIPDGSKRDALKQALASDPGIKDFSFSSAGPAYNSSFTDFSSPELGMTQPYVTEIKFIDERYMDLFGLKLLAGGKIVKTDSKDTVHPIVINEALMNKIGVSDPQKMIGKHVDVGGRTIVIGVVQDFVSGSKHKKIRPCVLTYWERQFYTASVRIEPKALHQTVARVEKLWTGLFPKDLFSYEFMDDHIASLYHQEEKEYTAFKLFSAIAILIGCMGLYGLVAFAAAGRTKEVGIRKVLGATLPDIVFLFTREFILLIAIAFIFAAPLAYFVMNSWLHNFAYQISIGWEIFLIAIVVSVIIAACTISYQAIRAAMANPVRALRAE